MSYYNSVKAVDVVGWTGIFKNIKEFSYQDTPVKLPPGMLPNSVHGAIALYPARKSRYIETTVFGWTQLDLYFRTFNTSTIKELMEAKTGKSYFFSGAIKERLSNKKDYDNLHYEIDSLLWAPDKFNGKYSLQQAHLICSDQNEL